MKRRRKMMEVMVAGQKFKVSWKHMRETVPTESGYLREDRSTVCRIHNESGVLEAEDVATVGYGDSFNKAFGRRLSLTRALKTAEFNKAVRNVFWNKYFEVHKDPRGYGKDK
jgi:hypothetical protein